MREMPGDDIRQGVHIEPMVTSDAGLHRGYSWERPPRGMANSSGQLTAPR